MSYSGGYADGYAGAASGAGGLADQSTLTDAISVGGTKVGGSGLADSLRGTDALTAFRVVPTTVVGAPARMRLRLVAYTPGGAKRGDVPFGLSLSRYSQMGEVPTADAEYSFLQRNVTNLDGPVEVALQYSDVLGNWVEPINARYLIDKDDYDRLDNGQLVHRYGFLGYVKQLEYADVGAVSLNADGRRAFNSVTPGAIMLTLINQAKVAGFLPFVNVGFTANLTSDGQPWAKVCTRDYAPETDLLSVLRNLFDAGLADFWMDGRTLHMSNPDTVLGRDLSGGLSPIYVRDQTLTASPESVTYSDMITKVRVVGDNGLVFLRDNPTASRAFGERVKTLALGGVSDEGTAIIYADQLLGTGEVPSRSLSREYTVTEATKYAPERDYRTGDWIRADTATARGERMRAFATSVREENGELKAFVTLGTVHDDLLLRLAKRQNGITGGSGVNSGGTPAPVVPDTAVPAAPAGLVVDVEVYNDNAGYAQAVISATWSAVTQSVTNGPVEVVGYELWYRPNTTGATSQMLRATDTTTVGYSPLPTGKPFAFKVRALTSTRQGPFSPEVVVTTPTDVTPPPLPSLPTTTSTLGVITVAWDGLSGTAGGMPFDFDHVDVYQQQGAVAIPIDSLSLKGFTTIGGLTAGQTYNFALRAVDKTGNASPLTDWVPQAVVSQVYTTQISDAGITAPKIATNAVTADAIMAGSIDGMLITAPIIRTAATGQRSQFDSQGLRLWSAANVVKVWANPATGQLRIYNTTDASLTSTGHGLQFGDDTGPNLVIDNNEVLARNNGNFGVLLLNREGGQVLIGGKIGGFPTDDDAGQIPATENNTVHLRAATRILNMRNSDYADEFAPLMIGRPGGMHLWFDRYGIGATADTGDAVGTLQLHPPKADGSHHNESVIIASGSFAVRRWGVRADGTYSTLLYGRDGADLGIRFSGNSDRFFFTDGDGAGYRPISAASFDLPSQRKTKKDVTPVVDALAKVRKAPSSRWKYHDAIENGERDHVGPMFEDLPDEVTVPGNPDAASPEETIGMVSVPSMLGLLWEAVRNLADRVDALDTSKPPKTATGK